MKKIILILLLLLSILQADIVKGTTSVVNGNIFTYYCIDGGLWLEVYIKGDSSNTFKFQQVYTPGSTATPMRCNVIENRFEIKN